MAIFDRYLLNIFPSSEELQLDVLVVDSFLFCHSNHFILVDKSVQNNGVSMVCNFCGL